MDGTVTSLNNSIGIEFILIPAGDLWMYSKGYTHKEPVHKVTISRPFYLGKYPVTQKEWRAVMGDHPACFDGENRPVECVSWNNVQEFISKLNSKEGTERYRLPVEDEWEYACRGGTNTRYSFGDTDLKLGEYAWYYGNSDHETHQVGQKKPNPWGLYDMHGNVWEWCQDKHYRSYEEALAEGTAWETVGSTAIVLRGGSWVNYPDKCLSSSSSNFDSDYGTYSVGFRLFRSV